MKHGAYASQQATSVSTPSVAASGIPFVIGAAPVHSAEAPAAIGVPVLCTSFGEAVKKLGYSESESDWKKYRLCQFMHSHFMLYGCQPVIFCNLMDPATMKTAVAAADMEVVNHKITLPFDAVNDATLVVKEAGDEGTAYVKDTDYMVYYSDSACTIEPLEGGAIYDAATLSVAYSAVNPGAITDAAVATGMEAIEQCMGMVGIVPDTICAPGYSHKPAVGAVMATKASVGINGLFKAKALIDISTEAEGGAVEYNQVVAMKNANNFTDEAMIVCWPMVALGDHQYHMSTQLAGLMASVDTANDGCPYESPSNKNFKCDSVVLESGEPVNLSLTQANILNAGGIVTALGFIGGTVCWGNYTACFPTNQDVKDHFIPISRMFNWIGNSEIKTFWGKVDKPANRRLIDSILDSCNIWLNGLVGRGFLLGARAVMLEEENPMTDMMAGIFRIHNYITPPSPAQELNFIAEYDVSYVTAAFS